MLKHLHLNQWLYLLTIALAAVIFIDFELPGKAVTNEILEIKKERQQYYNAAQNFHYTYKIVTAEHSFTVSEDFAKEVSIGEKVEYAVSYLFNEVNRYASAQGEHSSIHSFRWVSGLILPLLTVIIMLLAMKYPGRLSIVSFVFQVLLIADLIYLIL